MRALVLGSGLQGSACAFDLLTTTDAKVSLADSAPEVLPAFLKPYLGKRLAVFKVDARDEKNMRDVMSGHDVVLSALPYYLNVDLARLAVSLRLPFADLGGNTEIVRQQEAMNAEAAQRRISVIPDCGLAPGLVNVLGAEGIRRLEAAQTVKMYVGGLPLHPDPPLNYAIVYSLEGTFDYYTTPSWVVRKGMPAQVDALSEVEPVKFPQPLGTLEAFHTAGGLSTMPWAFAGRVKTMEYKTLRYPGHASLMRAIRDLGLLDSKPVDVKGTPVVPRDAFIATVSPKLRKPEGQDLVVLKVVVTGKKKGQNARVAFRLIDRHDRRHQISAMMRTTGYSLSIVGQMQVDGRIDLKGVKPAWEAVPFGPYVEELEKRGISVEEV